MFVVREWNAQDRMRRQLDEWCRVHVVLPARNIIRCGECGGGMVGRWRSTGEAVKLGCLECGLETDVTRANDWMAKPLRGKS